MAKHPPIKRHKALHGLSREHHQGLLLCFKIRHGIKLGLAGERIKKYCDWFWETHLLPHFAKEEQFVFPVLGNDDPLVQQALQEHKDLEALFMQTQVDYSYLRNIENDLEAHIRFEERVLFNKLQNLASEEALQLIASQTVQGTACGIWEDEFWK
jgi:iron-sulfur cluster repair protein YtfE (RIC family)